MQTRLLRNVAMSGLLILLAFCIGCKESVKRPASAPLKPSDFTFDPGSRILVRPLLQYTNVPRVLPDGYDAWVECDVPVTVNHKNNAAVESRVDSWEVSVRFLQKPGATEPNLIVKALLPDSQSGHANSVQQRTTEQQERQGQFGAEGQARASAGLSGNVNGDQMRVGAGPEWYAKLAAEWQTRNDRRVEVSGPDIKPVITAGTRNNEQTAFWQFSTSRDGILFGRKYLTLLLLRPTGWKEGFAEFTFRIREEGSSGPGVEYTERIPVHLAKKVQEPSSATSANRESSFDGQAGGSARNTPPQQPPAISDPPKLSRAAMFVEEMAYWPWKFILISAAVGFVLAILGIAAISGIMSVMASKNGDQSASASKASSGSSAS